MNDHDLTTFEERFAARLRAHAAVAVTPIDGRAVAAALATTRPRLSFGLAWRSIARPVRVALVIVLIGALLATAAFVASRVTRPATTPSLTSTTGPLVFGPRSGATTILLGDGRVLVLGGTPTHRAELWDPATGQFTASGLSTISGNRPAVGLTGDGHVLIVTDAVPTAELYDPITGTFAMTGRMRSGRSRCHCGVSWIQEILPSMVSLADGRVMVLGGRSNPSDIPNPTPAETYAELYDPQTETFRQVEIGCDAGRGAKTRLSDSRVLVTCLVDMEGETSQARLFDPTTNTFATTGAPTSTSSQSAFVLSDGRVLLTGEGRRAVASRAELYDPATGSFREISGATNPSVNAPGVALADGRVLFLGQGGTTSSVFDPVALRFAPVLAGVRIDVGGTPVLLRDGRVFVVGSGETATVVDPRLIP
ncbi:MAG TPA: hypothetical protein VGQ89_07130 [Candidatus Limnocylindrales bacterium]|jgi:hypothetical protein|nr:hypothetical protein [Candidatus Limnocylindrales bacterium]